MSEERGPSQRVHGLNSSIGGPKSARFQADHRYLQPAVDFSRKPSCDERTAIHGAGRRLIKAGREDVIGNECDCLIPTHPPKAAIDARRRRANEAAEGNHYHSIANPAKGEPAGKRDWPNKGYRPGRKSGRRQDRKWRRNREQDSSNRS